MRKTPQISISKTVSMINLFQRKIDETIVLINVELDMIQTENGLYEVNFSKNSVEKISFQKYKLEINEPFD